MESESKLTFVHHLWPTRSQYWHCLGVSYRQTCVYHHLSHVHKAQAQCCWVQKVNNNFIAQLRGSTYTFLQRYSSTSQSYV